MTAAKRIAVDRCCGLIIDVQEFFLSQIDTRLRSKLETNIKNFARLLGYFRVPMVATLERPVDQKGALPKEIAKHLREDAKIFEKDFFDLTKEKKIADYIARLKNKHIIVAGCETDVCVLQSCLGLLALGYASTYGGARVFLIAKRRRGDRQNEGRRRRVPDLQEPLLRADRGG